MHIIESALSLFLFLIILVIEILLIVLFWFMFYEFVIKKIPIFREILQLPKLKKVR